jgi:hypothetical protein
MKSPIITISGRDADVMRFASKVALPDDLNDSGVCWEWQGAKHGQGRGYGKFHLGGKSISAHKASYILFVGDVEEGQVIGHQCNNEGCVSPHHLKAESQSQNIKFMWYCRRHRKPKRNATATEVRTDLGEGMADQDEINLISLDNVDEVEF